MPTRDDELRAKSAVRWRWLLYILLLIIRVCIGPLLPGYIHPDEFFQGGQELWFGCPPTIPWEFEPDNALRSVIPPVTLTWIPLKLYAFLIQRPMDSLSGQEVLMVPRVACSIMSVLTVDWSIWSLANPKAADVPIQVLLLASAWPALVMLSRPFSNALETCILSLLLATILKKQDDIAWHTCVKVGILCALGTFTRFTFVFFAFPSVLYFLYIIWTRKPTFQRLVSRLAAFGISFLLAGAAIIYADSMFYLGRQGRGPYLPGDPIFLTPWNALSYNSKVANLETHGLHPRWTHALVNMFILYGPLALASYLNMSSALSPQLDLDTVPTELLSRMVVLFGLAFLSLAPHQEPRFLLPLITPLALHAGCRFTSRFMWYIWIAFNIVLFLLFGVIHQGGVVRSLTSVGETSLSQKDVTLFIFFRTYMPPTFVSRRASRDTCQAEEAGTCSTNTHAVKNACGNTRILDLNGSTFSKLQNVLNDQLACDNEGKDGLKSSVILATPLLSDTVDGKLWQFGESCEVPGFKCQKVQSFPAHLTTEDLPVSNSLYDLYRNMSMGLYEIWC